MTETQKNINAFKQVENGLTEAEKRQKIAGIFERACEEQRERNEQFRALVSEIDSLNEQLDLLKRQTKTIVDKKNLLKSQMDSDQRAIISAAKQISPQKIKKGYEIKYFEAYAEGIPENELKKYLTGGGYRGNSL
jgi:hypothetical protein